MGARGESKTERAGETVPRPGDAAARRGTRGKWVVFALIPSLVALLLLEIAARVYERGTEERIQLVAPDELRHRDGEVLVYVYGESTVWGVPVTELGLVAQMQYLADRRSPGRRIRILNLGVPGIDSTRLRAFVEDTLGNRPDLAIVLCGHNEFLRAPAGRRPPGVLRHSALARVTSLAVAKFTLTLEDATPDGLTVPVDRTGAAFRRRQEIYRENMDAIARTAREQGVPVVLTSLPSNLADWPPVFRRLARADGDASYEPAMERALAADAAGDVNTLQSFVDEWQARAPDDAMVRFLRGRLRLWHGERRGAVEDLVFARDEDPIPWRMTSTLVASVRDVAARANAPFVDLADAVGEGDIPGSELILDNCHPSPEGAHRMALALLRAVEHAGLLPPPEDVSPPVQEFLAAAGATPGSPLRLRLLLENGKYAMRRPLYQYPIAERCLRRAVLEYPSSWEAHANLATSLLLQQKIAEGRAELRQAEVLHGGPLDLTDREKLPYLQQTLDALTRR